jgi:Ni,Fe-hydrogenase III component G
MIQIIRFTYNDDSFASIDVDVMVCSSKDCAKEIILNEINKGFNGKWKNLREAANELDNDIENCSFLEDENKFMWYDNGKGEAYLIGNLDVRELNTEFQNIGVI